MRIISAGHSDSTFAHLRCSINRHYVRTVVEEGGGWASSKDLVDDGWLSQTYIDAVAASRSPASPRQRLPSRSQQPLPELLLPWGYERDGDLENLAAAETRAEAASPLDRVVPIFSLGLKRWRTEVVEPLLSPESNGQGDGHTPPSTPNADKFRLNKAVKDLLDRPDARNPTSIALVKTLADSLKSCGIRLTHPLLKQLDEFSALNNGS